ncbi:hypothetical protein Zmor_021664 [Zophobas morio]|uniref:Uncharacterized protein n=1 Tax=Zophobas morio TaxID=2755281 RepID=A0AA38I6I8_9CUCU|nr:hypothetical protein Zmor_021664 [Zophobas morio]
MQRQRHQSVAIDYVNFALEHNKNIHRGLCSTSGVWGSRSWLFSPTTVILSIASLPHSISLLRTCVRQAVTVANAQLDNADGELPARQRTAYSASTTYFGVIYLNSILNV